MCGSMTRIPNAHTLTESEKRIWELYEKGMTPKQIAAELGQAYSGIHSRLSVVKEKVQAAKWR